MTDVLMWLTLRVSLYLKDHSPVQFPMSEDSFFFLFLFVSPSRLTKEVRILF